MFATSSMKPAGSASAGTSLRYSVWALAFPTTRLAPMRSPDASTTPVARPSTTSTWATSALVRTVMPAAMPDAAIALEMDPMPPRIKPAPPAAVVLSRMKPRIRTYAEPGDLMPELAPPPDA